MTVSCKFSHEILCHVPAPLGCMISLILGSGCLACGLLRESDYLVLPKDGANNAVVLRWTRLDLSAHDTWQWFVLSTMSDSFLSFRVGILEQQMYALSDSDCGVSVAAKTITDILRDCSCYFANNTML